MPLLPKNLSLVNFVLFAVFANFALSLQCNYSDTQFREQKVDHFGKSKKTFKQQYQIIDDFYKAGGPILFYQGAENDQITCLSDYSLVTYANETGGLLVQIEHRYYGDSLPFGPINSTLTYDWDYLTLDNVMADSVEFLQFIKQNSTFTKAKTIVFGGSYGGYLATMLRLNHGDVFDGAVATGFPLYLNGADFPNNSYNDVQALWVNNVIQDISKTAADRINGTYSELSKYYTSGRTQELLTKLNLCTEPKNATDIAILSTIFASGLQRLSQFNFPMAAVANVSFPIQYIVNQTLQSTDSLAALKAFTSIYARSVNQDRLDCFDWAAGGSAGVGGTGGVQEGPYLHMVCTYFPISMDITPENTIFPAANASQYACGTIFGPGKTKMLTQVELAQDYNYSLKKISGLTNFIGLWGQYDPLTGLFPHDFPLTSNRRAARKIFVSGMAHTGDMIAQSKLDPPALVQARSTVVQYIKDWCALP